MKRYLLNIIMVVLSIMSLNAQLTCNKKIIHGNGGDVIIDSISTLTYRLTAFSDAQYKFAYWHDINKSILFDNPLTLSIDSSYTKYALEALFVKADAFIAQWNIDNIIIKSLSTYISDNDAGYANIYVNDSEYRINMVPVNIDNGVWQLNGLSSLLSNNNAGKHMRLLLFNECKAPTSVIDTIIPYIVNNIANSDTIDFVDNMNVEVLENGILCINNNSVIAGNLNIYGKVIVDAGKQLTVNSICMHGNGIRQIWPQLVVNGSIVNNSVINYDYELDFNAYYPLALPQTVKCNTTYNPINGASALYQSYYYNSELRQTGKSGWTIYDDTQHNAQFSMGTGYIIYAVPMKWHDNYQQTAIIRFPMEIDLSAGESEKTIDIFYSDNDNGKICDKNWNFIGNPYLADFTINNTDKNKLLAGFYNWNSEILEYELDSISTPYIRYITYSDDGYKTYKQERTDNFVLKPFNSYFIQTQSGNGISFLKSDRTNNMPKRIIGNNSHEIKTGIILMQNKEIDNTGFIFGNYCNNYEINADLIKEFGDMSKMSLYSIQTSNGWPLSFQAFPNNHLGQIIKLGYSNLNKNQLAIFSFDYTYDTSDISHIWLTDNKTNIHTDLLESNYEFMPYEENNGDRFYITVEEKQNKVATDIENITTDDSILIYDILGRQIKNKQLLNHMVLITVDNNGNYRKEIK